MKICCDEDKKYKFDNVKLNLGAGPDYLFGYINIDTDPTFYQDIYIDFKKIGKMYQPESVDEILLSHSIGYLNLWEAIDLLKDIYTILRFEKKLVIETTDILKCAAYLIFNKENDFEYIEAIRAIYAFDPGQIQRKEQFDTYKFGWSESHLKKVLNETGFSKVESRSPQGHGQTLWRDIRIEATK